MTVLLMNRAEAVGLFGIVHTNLVNSTFEITRPGENDNLFVSVKSVDAPGAEVVYEIPPEGGPRIVKEEGIIEGLLRQPEDDPDV